MKLFANNNLLSLKVDAEKGTGPEIAKKYKIKGFPTAIIVNSRGEEIDRIIGYLAPKFFLNELKRIKSGKNTIPSLLLDFQSNPENFSTLFTLAKKYESRGDIASAKRMINAILASGFDSSGVANFFSILYQAREDQSHELLIAYAKENSGSNNVQVALSEAMYFIRKKGNENKLEADIFLQLISLETQNTPNILNSFCWRMSQLEIHLEIALEKITLAIENAENDKEKFMFIDTKAELFYKLKEYDSAIIEIEKCLNFDSESKYYKDQLAKFYMKKTSSEIS